MKNRAQTGAAIQTDCRQCRCVTKKYATVVIAIVPVTATP